MLHLDLITMKGYGQSRMQSNPRDALFRINYKNFLWVNRINYNSMWVNFDRLCVVSLTCINGQKSLISICVINKITRPIKFNSVCLVLLFFHYMELWNLLPLFVPYEKSIRSIVSL